MPFMKPNEEFITIDDNLNKISDFINDMIISPRKNAHKWSELTNQTPNLKMGYPGQHLASLIVGMKGTATGARGDDIVDGTEVKPKDAFLNGDGVFVIWVDATGLSAGEHKVSVTAEGIPDGEASFTVK